MLQGQVSKLLSNAVDEGWREHNARSYAGASLALSLLGLPTKPWALVISRRPHPSSLDPTDFRLPVVVRRHATTTDSPIQVLERALIRAGYFGLATVCSSSSRDLRSTLIDPSHGTSSDSAHFDTMDPEMRERLSQDLINRGVRLVGSAVDKTGFDPSPSDSQTPPPLLASMTFFGVGSGRLTTKPDISYYNKKWGVRAVNSLAGTDDVLVQELEGVYKFVRNAGIQLPHRRVWSFWARPPLASAPNLGARALWHLLSLRPRFVRLAGFDFYLSTPNQRADQPLGRSQFTRKSMTHQRICATLSRHNCFEHFEFFRSLRDQAAVDCYTALDRLLNLTPVAYAHRLEENYWSY